MVSSVFRLLREIVFPRRCAACGTKIDSGLFCPFCRGGTARIKRCQGEGLLKEILVLYSYEAAVKEAFHSIKFRGEKDTALVLREEARALWDMPAMQEQRKNFPGSSGWIWCGIPTDPARLRTRGFELPELLFREWAGLSGGRWEAQLCRLRKNLPMYGLSPEERRRNLEDCFGVIHDVRGKHIMLTDDIFTTGATFAAAADILYQAGAKRVKAIAFCGSTEVLR